MQNDEMTSDERRIYDETFTTAREIAQTHWPNRPGTWDSFAAEKAKKAVKAARGIPT